ncbi:MAG: 1-acyl-sn-glycerol-3-phosphate acyltransferase [Candidatus Nomurabacteria bacterium]|nr:1-acyl-sn-glycerol-3-phosphate acyltransferase [Candidatus Nomurabacteria bacterium]
MNKKVRPVNLNPKTGLPVLNEESRVKVRPRHGLVYWLAVVVLFPILWLLFWPRVKGRHNIPKRGGVVFAFNHISDFDFMLVQGTLPRMLFFMAKADLCQPPLGWLLGGAGLIPVDRARKNSGALDGAVRVLKGGGAVAIAPEGHTNKNKELLPFKFGAVAMAQRAKVKVVPVAITGRPIPFFGKFSIEYSEPMVVGKDLEKANQQLRSTIQQMTDSRAVQKPHVWLQVLLKPLVLAVFQLVYRVEVVGRENIPKRGALVIATNHKHVHDQFPIMLGRPLRRMYFMAKIEYAKQLVGWPMSRFGVVFVDRQAKDKSAMKQVVVDILNKGQVLGIFPEGTRNKTDQLLIPFKFGAVRFAQKTGAKLVPAAIIGEYRPFRKGPKIVFAPPMAIGSNDSLEKANQQLYDTIEKMMIDSGERIYRQRIYEQYQERDGR